MTRGSAHAESAWPLYRPLPKDALHTILDAASRAHRVVEDVRNQPAKSVLDDNVRARILAAFPEIRFPAHNLPPGRQDPAQP